MDPYCAKYGGPATVVILRSVVSLITVADERPLMKVRGLFLGVIFLVRRSVFLPEIPLKRRFYMV